LLDQLPRAQQQVLGLLVEIIRSVMNRECGGVITNTGSSFVVPSPSGIFRGGTTDHTAPRRRPPR
jgi:hypothetical protein